MPKDTKTLGYIKAPACESRGFVIYNKWVHHFDTPSFLFYNVINPKYQAAAAAPAKMHKVINTLAQAGIPVFAYGSFNFIFGYLATSVKVSPNGILILAAAFTAQPLAFKSGAMLRRRSFIHAMTIDGPEIINKIPKNDNTNCHHSRAKIPSAKLANAVPIMPTAIPIAAKIPANLAMSNGGVAAGLAASAGAAPSAGAAGAAGSAVGAALI